MVAASLFGVVVALHSCGVSGCSKVSLFDLSLQQLANLSLQEAQRDFYTM